MTEPTAGPKAGGDPTLLEILVCPVTKEPPE